MSKQHIYYAHPITSYGSKQEELDLKYLAEEFPDKVIVNPSSKEVQESFDDWKKQNKHEHQMRFFKPLVQSASAVFYRKSDQGNITSGVRYEINKAVEAGVETFDLGEMVSSQSITESKELAINVINVDGDVDSGDLVDFVVDGRLTIQFGDVTGDFDCGGLGLTTLVGCPKKVGETFCCHDNSLISLEGCPKSVGGDFHCDNNQLTSLEGGPQEVGDFFNCSGNQLTSLENAPQSVGGDFHCSWNLLTTLKGAPQIVGGHFNCSTNQLTSLEGAPKSVGDDFYCSNNPKLIDPSRPLGIGKDFYYG